MPFVSMNEHFPLNGIERLPEFCLWLPKLKHDVGGSSRPSLMGNFGLCYCVVFLSGYKQWSHLGT